MSNRVIQWLMLVPVVLTLASCANSGFYRGANPEIAPSNATYYKFLTLAIAGDPEYQNLLGYMYVNGKGTDKDLKKAHRWFHKAAATGHSLAQLNDLYMHELINAPIYDAQAGGDTDATQRIAQQKTLSSNITANNVPALEGSGDQQARGERVYLVFCAGCHGSNGIAAYVNSPSFVLNERLEKSDAELFQSVNNGIGEMPGWGGMLPDHDLLDAIAFIRTLQPSYERGISQSIKANPPRYFLFGAMSSESYFYRIH